MSEHHATHVILVPGFWLGAWAWDDVVARLVAVDLTPHSITPLGLEVSGARSAGTVTLADRIGAVVDVVDRVAAGGAARIVVVGHSGGGAVVQGVVDRRHTSIDRVIYVDSGPLLDGTSMANVTIDPPDGADLIPLPDWSVWQEAAYALTDLDDAMRAEFRRRSVPEPADVARSVVALADPRRLTVPATVICTSIPSGQVQELMANGHLPSELDQVDDVTFLDLPTGHWPMFSRPADLAAMIAEQARRSDGRDSKNGPPAHPR